MVFVKISRYYRSYRDIFLNIAIGLRAERRRRTPEMVCLFPSRFRPKNLAKTRFLTSISHINFKFHACKRLGFRVSMESHLKTCFLRVEDEPESHEQFDREVERSPEKLFEICQEPPCSAAHRHRREAEAS